MDKNQIGLGPTQTTPSAPNKMHRARLYRLIKLIYHPRQSSPSMMMVGLLNSLIIQDLLLSYYRGNVNSITI